MGRSAQGGNFADLIASIDERLRLLERSRFRAPAVSADPSPVAAGDIWIRSDTGQLCWHDGTTVRRIDGS